MTDNSSAVVSAFYMISVVTIVSALGVISQRNAVHALLYLILLLISMAMNFFILGSPFAAALEVIVYAGAIVVMFVFVVMILNAGSFGSQSQVRSPYKKNKIPISANLKASLVSIGYFQLGFAILLGLVLLGEVVHILPSLKFRNIQAISPESVGIALFGPYLLGVELSSFLLLAGLIGAHHLGRNGRP